MFDIIIPTCKTEKDIESQLVEIEFKTPEEHRIIATCKPVSAAKNRNYAHSWTKSDIVIMMDDDIRGFSDKWLTTLIQPLLDDINVRFCSARFLKVDGRTPNFMMTSKSNLLSDYEDVPRCTTGCFAYRKEDFDALIGFWNKDSKPFDENFIGSGWEDNGICFDLKKKFPGTKIVINNKCKVIHVNEMKNQQPYLKQNKEYFYNSGRFEK